jgi:hypothetical protein
VSGLQAAVFAGMAVTVLCRCALVGGMREIPPNEGFLPLPKVDLLLYKAPGASSPAVDALHDYLAHYLGLSSSSVVKLHRSIPRPQSEPTPQTDAVPRQKPKLAFPR